MKRLMAVFFLGMFSLVSRAESPIRSMDQGSCWIQAVDSGYKISSFGSNVAFSVYADSVSPAGSRMKDWLQSQLKKKFPHLPAMKYEVGFHCFSTGHLLTFQIQKPGQPICVTGVMETNGISLIQISPDEVYREGTPCLGLEERVLGLILKSADDAEVNAIRARIAQSSELSEMIEVIQKASGSTFATARLKSAYAYREVEARQKWEIDAELMKHVSLVYLDAHTTITGEDKILFQGNVDSF